MTNRSEEAHAVLFVGDDWAEDHHDVELVDEAGTVLARKRLPEGLAGVTGLHALIGEHLPDPGDDPDPHPQVMVGIETERGPWVASLVAAGYTVYALNPKSVARYRERHSTSGAKSDAADAHLMAEIVRLDRAAHRPVAGDTELAEGIKLAARSHQNLVWERTRHVLRLRSALREFYPAALTAFPELDAPDALELLGKAPDPDTGARLSRRTIAAAYARANRRDPAARADEDGADPARRRTAATRPDPGIVRGDHLQRGRDHRRLEHPDRGPGEGGGRPFWATPGS